MKIVDRNVDEIKPYDNNPRHNEAAVESLANSIRSFGFKVPIVIDKEGVIVTGHTRLLAAKELGLKKVPCIVASDLTEDQIRAFRLADNKVSEKSSWDFGKLEQELAAMEIAEIDMADFGFDLAEEASDIDSLFESQEPSQPEPKKRTIVCPHCGEAIEMD